MPSLAISRCRNLPLPQSCDYHLNISLCTTTAMNKLPPSSLRLSGLYSLLYALIWLASPACHSDELLGLRLAITPWLADISGEIQTAVEVEAGEDGAAEGENGVSPLLGTAVSPSHMGLKDSLSLAYQVEFRHNLPLIPRLRVTRTALVTKGSTILANNEVFGELTFAANTEVSSKLDLSFTDFTLYYTVWDGFGSLDLGLNSRRFAGSASRTAVTAVEVDPETPEPTPDESVSAAMAFEPRSTLFAIQPRLQYPEMPMQLALSYMANVGGATEIKDLEAKFALHWPTGGFDYQIEAGYRRLIIDGENIDGLTTQIKVSGPFVAIRIVL